MWMMRWRSRSGFGVANGFEWTADGSAMFVTDTSTSTIHRASYGPDGQLGELVPFISGAAHDGLVRDHEDCLWTGLKATNANYLLDLAELPTELEVQVRYRTAPVRARVLRADAEGFELEFAEPQFAVAPGQSAVLYAGPRLLGGGLIADHARELPPLGQPPKKRPAPSA